MHRCVRFEDGVDGLKLGFGLAGLPYSDTRAAYEDESDGLYLARENGKFEHRRRRTKAVRSNSSVLW